MTAHDNKSFLRQYVNAYRSADFAVMAAAVKTFYAPNASINIVHPFNEHNGSVAYIDEFLQPLTHSFNGLRRTEYIAIGGEFVQLDYLVY